MDDLRQRRSSVSASWRAGSTAAALAVTFLVLAACATQAQNYNEETIYSFRGSDGASPYGGLAQDSAGNLYGTTYQGGYHNLGAVFKLDTAGKETVLHSFGGQQDGAYPMGVTLVLDSAQNLYGTTSDGGGYGVIFKMNAKGKETVLRILKQWNGATPYAGVIRDANGNVYATAAAGGGENGGVVFKVTGVRKGKILHSFMGGKYGRYPEAPIVQDAEGNFYGTTYHGGGEDVGTVFKLNKNGSETPLHSFRTENGLDGYYPQAGLVLDAAGNLYGTTSQGGVGGSNGGMVFKMDKAGTETVLHTFEESDGWYPGFGSLLLDSQGNLYGTTEEGGADNYGVVFKIDSTGNESVLYSFTGGEDGSTPWAGLIKDRAGNFYGTTAEGGAYGYGVVFKLSPK